MSFNRQGTNSSSTSYRPFRAAVTGPVLVSSTPVQVLGSRVANTTAAIAYVQYFNAGSVGAVTLGTTVPTDTVAVAASGVINHNKDQSAAYPNGLVIAVTTDFTGATVVGTAVPVVLDVA